MNTRIIDIADAVVRRYKTRNPEDIISQRAIKLKDIRFCHDLLGCHSLLHSIFCPIWYFPCQ